jgi:hypothetical protein
MYPASFHPAKPNKRRDWKGQATYYTRTQRPPRYWLADYGLSKIYDLSKGSPMDIPILGGDQSLPEYLKHKNQLCNQFAVDIYCLGNWVKREFIDVSISSYR